VWPSHLHLFGGYAPFPVSQAELGPIRLSQLDRSHNDQRSQLCIPRYGAWPALNWMIISLFSLRVYSLRNADTNIDTNNGVYESAPTQSGLPRIAKLVEPFGGAALTHNFFTQNYGFVRFVTADYRGRNPRSELRCQATGAWSVCHRKRSRRARGGTVYPAQSERRGRVALLQGCAQQVLSPGINTAAIRMLTRQGVEVVLVKNEHCCGSLTRCHFAGCSLSSCGTSVRP
jgi:hypothetical protein